VIKGNNAEPRVAFAHVLYRPIKDMGEHSPWRVEVADYDEAGDFLRFDLCFARIRIVVGDGDLSENFVG
jgi:hypothetical protein